MSCKYLFKKCCRIFTGHRDRTFVNDDREAAVIGYPAIWFEHKGLQGTYHLASIFHGGISLVDKHIA